MTGKVYLVGAGPGDPELLTLKAARVLRNADVVLHDELIGHEILRLAPPHAQIDNVGKRCGNNRISQEGINSLMVSLAQAGMQVVRLKGGDPSIFGRLGEEIAALRKADIEFEIVPGISAAQGAASVAQVSLTQRHISSAVVFVAGHLAAGSDPTNWSALVASGATLVVYMPGHEYSLTAGHLSTSGLSGETDCTIVSRATTSDEQVVWTNVGRLGEAPHLPAPTLLLIGNVLRPAAWPRLQQELGAEVRGFPINSSVAVPMESPLQAADL